MVRDGVNADAYVCETTAAERCTKGGPRDSRTTEHHAVIVPRLLSVEQVARRARSALCSGLSVVKQALGGH
eukprot:4531077-Alexandrium_andersonii.AAC.1